MMTRRPRGLIRRRGRSRSRFLLRECFVVESRQWWWCRPFCRVSVCVVYRFGAKQIFVTAPENVYRGATEGVKICTETQRTRRG